RLGVRRRGGTSRSGVAPGAAQGAGECGQPLDRSDGVRRTPRSADGQQYGGADATRTGGGPEELLRQRIGVEQPPRSDDVLAAADAVPVGPEPAAVASCLPASVRR